MERPAFGALIAGGERTKSRKRGQKERVQTFQRRLHRGVGKKKLIIKTTTRRRGEREKSQAPRKKSIGAKQGGRKRGKPSTLSERDFATGKRIRYDSSKGRSLQG